MDTLHLDSSDNKDEYRPAFMDHFDRMDGRSRSTQESSDGTGPILRKSGAGAGAGMAATKDGRRSHTDFEYVRELI